MIDLISENFHLFHFMAGIQCASPVMKEYTWSDFIKTCMEVYPEWVLPTAIALYVLHRFMPYSFRGKFPDDPPPKFIGSFSLGQLVQYIIQVLSFPIVLAVAAWISLSVPGKVGEVISIILVGIWGIVPRVLSKEIDGW